MGSEYLFFSPFEYKEVKKSLLNSELSSLNSLESLHKYKKFRLDELNQKIKIKNLLTESLDQITILEKMMPQTRFGEERPKKITPKPSSPETQVKSDEEIKRTINIQSQLSEIKRKLSLLQ